MFCRAKHLLRRCRTNFLALVLIPAVFFGTLPQAACICADGQRLSFCPKRVCGLTHLQPAVQKRSCCQSHRHVPDGVNSSGSSVSKAPGCCQLVHEQPSPAVTASKVVVDSTLASDLTASPFSCFAVLYAPFHLAELDSTPPPLDAVILFSRLTI